MTGSTGNTTTITTDSLYRYITGNGIPGHVTGAFPNPNNPNSISAQSYNWRCFKSPSAAGSYTAGGLGKKAGTARNSVPFDPYANEWYQNNPATGWQYEPKGGGVNLGIDSSNAHVQPNGAYHYHGLPMGLLNLLSYTTQMAIVGWAADGFPIYGPYCYSVANNSSSGLRQMTSSFRLKSGTRSGGPGGVYDGTFEQDWEYVAGLGDLDQANGRTGVTPEFPGSTYYYVLTNAYPYIPRYMRGTPDRSFGY
ncbi:MAG: YHYH protein [Armatimonadota bacterium]